MKKLILILVISMNSYADFFETDNYLEKVFPNVSPTALKAGCHGGAKASACNISLGEVQIAKDVGILFPNLPNLNAIRLATITAIHKKKNLDLYASKDDRDLVVALLNGESLNNTIFNGDRIELNDIDPSNFKVKSGSNIYLFNVLLNIKNKRQLFDLVKSAQQDKRKVNLTFFDNEIRKPSFSFSE